MKNSRWLVILIALFLILLITSVPRIHTVENVDASHMNDYPALQAAYHQICQERPHYEIQTEDTIQIVTVQNLWGSWERYILPCYSAVVPNVPRAGSADAHAELYVLAPWSDESFFTNIFRLKVRDFSLYMEPGENLFVSEQASLTHSNLEPVHYIVYAKLIQSSEAIICSTLPTVSVDYSVATFNSALEPNTTSTTTFTWDYSLRFFGRKIRTGAYVFEIDHIINA